MELNEFSEKVKSIDEEISEMSYKSNKISKAFLILDIGVSVMIPIAYTCFSIVADAMI